MEKLLHFIDSPIVGFTIGFLCWVLAFYLGRKEGIAYEKKEQRIRELQMKTPH